MSDPQASCLWVTFERQNGGKIVKAKKIWLLLLLAAVLLLATSCSSGFKFEGRTINAGKVGEQYSENIAIDKEGIYYELDYTDNLPMGLVLSEDGAISGMPEEYGTFTFTLIAVDSKDNFKEADFTIVIEKGTIAYKAKALEDAKAGEPYVQNIGTATGMPVITYAVKAGSALPAGLALTENGEISGVPETAAENVQFTVVATAKGCDPVEATFTMNVAEGAKSGEGATDLGYIVYEGFTLPDGLVGTEYNESIRTAYGVPDITYKIKYIGGIGFPKGLSFNKLGTITGKPTNSTSGVMRFNVIASAEGCESVTAEFQLRIYDAYEATNRMEAEHIDVSDLKGAGYSGSAGGLAMLQSYAKASGGKALGYLNTAATFSFYIQSAEDTTANLTLGVATEWGELTLTPKTFRIFVNEIEIDYGAFTMPDTGYGNDMEFPAYTLEPKVKLEAGENIIRFEIIDSEDTGGVGTATAKGPIFDYLQIDNASCEIGWRPRVANTK